MLPDIVAGGGLGLLLGYLLGLSMTPVVQGVVVAVTGLLGAALGLKQGEPGGQAWRVGAFGVFCVAGITAGLAVRAGSLLTPSVADEVGRWEAAGYARPDAMAFVAYARLGVKPANFSVGEAPAAKQEANALYATETRSACNAIGLVGDPAEKIALARRFGFGAEADAAAGAPNPAEALSRALKCGG